MADEDRYLTGGGELVPEQRSASYSTNTSLGPFSGGAILSGQDDGVPMYGGRFTTQLPEGLSATLSRTNQAGETGAHAVNALRLVKQIDDNQLALSASRMGEQGLPSYGLQYSGQIGKQGGAKPYYPAPSGNWYVEAGGTPSTPERHIMLGAKGRFADGGTVEAALHAIRHHLAGGGFLSDLFSGPDYLSTGEVASPTNWGDPESAADFFKADKALRLAREVQASEPARDTPLPPRRPVEAAPRQQIASPPPAPAPTPEPAPVNIPYAAPTRPMQMIDITSPPHLTERPGFGSSLTISDLPRADTTPEISSRGLQNYTLPEAAFALPAPQAEINRAVSLAQNIAPAQQETIPSAADALAAVEKLHNAGVYSGEALDKAGEILAAHNRAKFDNIPVEEALRLNRAAGPMMINQGMPREERPAVQPLAYTAASTPAPASAAIDQATSKLTARAPQGPDLNDRQRDLIIRTIAAETSGKSPEESQAIAHVILNRIQSGKYGATPEAVLFARKQFEPWSKPGGPNDPMRFTPESRRYGLGQTALDAALGAEDITNGATNFWAPKAQAALGRRPPKWGRTGGVDIGETRFHNLSRAEGGLVDDALHVVREHHADGEAVGQAPEMPAEEPRPLTIYRDNRPQSANAGAAMTRDEDTYGPANIEERRARIQELTTPTNYPGDKLEAPMGYMTPATAVEWKVSDAGPYAVDASGTTLPLIPQPGMLPMYRDPTIDSIRPAMPGLLDLAGNVVGAPAGITAMRTARAVMAGERPAANVVSAMGDVPSVNKALNVVAQQPRELSPLGFYSHGAETAAGLQQAKGSPEQMVANLRRSAVRPEELYNSGIADEAATLAKRTMIESEYAPKVEAAKQAMEGLAPGTPEFTAAERQFKNISSSMRAEMDNAMVLHPDWASRPNVTREELVQHFQQRMPQIEETVLGGSALEKVKAQRDTVGAEWERLEIGDPRRDALKQQWENLDTKFRNMEIEGQYNPTKFGQYTLPGGENYREVLLKMPEGYGAPKQALDDLAAARQRFKNLDKRHGDELEAGLTGDMNMSYEDFDKLTRERDIAAARVKNFEKLANQPVFQDPHWNDPNVIAHLRFSDRVGPNGEKILHMEEAQSGWGQKGRKEGFKNPSVEARQAEIENALNQLRQEKIDSGMALERKFKENTQEFNAEYKRLMQPAEDALNSSRGSTSDINAYNAASDKVMEQVKHLLEPHERARDVAQHAIQKEFSAKMAPLQQEYSALPKIGSMSTAPYVTSTQAWTDLAIKRALKEAAEGGYDKLVWTPGAEQAKRYDLSRHVDNITWSAEPDGKYWVGATKDGRPVRGLENEPMDAKKLEATFGKEIAEKIVKGEGKKMVGGPEMELTGLDLQTGGEGMRGYYDKIWPNQLGKQAKKLDPSAKVGITDVLLPPKAGIGHNNPPFEAPGLTITPKMRESILNGQMAFKDGGSVVDRALMLVSKQA